MMKKKYAFYKIASILAVAIFIFAFVSCKKKDAPEVSVEDLLPVTVIKTASHNWYYFTEDKMLNASTIDSVSENFPKPWTNAVRVSSSLQCDNVAYMCVNNLGMLTLDGEKPDLFSDKSIFYGMTSGNLMCIYPEVPVIHIYKDTFFNSETESASATSESKGFLYQFRADTGIFFPLISKDALSIPKDSKITDLALSGGKLYATVKGTFDNRTVFEYIKFEVPSPDRFLSSSKLNVSIGTEKISADEFRAVKSPKDFSDAPARLKHLFSRLPESLPISVTMQQSNEQKDGEVQFVRADKNATDSEIFKCHAVMAKNWSIALFEDGTTFFAGALLGYKIVNGGEPVAFRLPKLPAGFCYKNVAIAGSKLYAAWEESQFYNTLRAGIIEVDLTAITDN